VVEHGLRQVFPRLADHPVLAGIAPNHLRDWRGDATNTAPRLTYELRPMHGPTVQWCGIPVPRPWRCGNRGNVASVLIEKPTRGDFLPIVDGGYSLQYAPLMEYRDGDGLILFCQLDVTGRTEVDPAADTIVHNLLRHVAAWKPPARRKMLYVGEEAGRKHFDASAYDGGEITPDQVLVVGPDAARRLAGHRAAVARFLQSGGRALAIGVGPDEVALLAPNAKTRQAEFINSVFAPPPHTSMLAGIGPADAHQRAPRPAHLVGEGVPSVVGNVVFYPVAPWQLNYPREYNLKRTYRRSSFLLTRVAANLGVREKTPLPAHFARPPAAADKRWLAGLYHDQPEEWDDPYRFFRW
jgi:beta-galactosidase